MLYFLNNGQQVELSSDAVLEEIKSASKVVKKSVDDVISDIILEIEPRNKIFPEDVGAYVLKRVLA